MVPLSFSLGSGICDSRGEDERKLALLSRSLRLLLVPPAHFRSGRYEMVPESEPLGAVTYPRRGELERKAALGARFFPGSPPHRGKAK